MPKKIIENTTPDSVPSLPILKPSSRNRITTKHLSNCSLYLPSNQSSLLSWLVYQVGSDNSFRYGENLVLRYVTAVKVAAKIYGQAPAVNLDFKLVRFSFYKLISGGYILPTTEKGLFILSPMLSYHPKYLSRKDYVDMCGIYAKLRADKVVGFADWYRSIINKKAKKNGNKEV